MSPHLLGHPRCEAYTWGDDDLRGLPVITTAVLSVGAGLASFALVDLLRIAGVSAADIRVVGPHPDPTDNFRFLARNAQITERDRLRSDSAARVDNAWGFPGYASTECWAERSIKPLLRVLLEPLGAEYFTPRSAAVYRGAAAEATRIGWPRMHIGGTVEMIRPHEAGGYVSLVRTADGDRLALRSQIVHMGLGHPSARVPADVARMRELHGSSLAAVNAYERHDHVYRRLAHTGGVVVVRGAGITASRVLERLICLREDSGADIRIVHLVRRHGTGGRPHRRHRVPRFGTAHLSPWDYQSFNFPKAALGGQVAVQLAALDDRDERARRTARLAGTTTAPRRAWREQLRRAELGGYYRLHIGTATELRPSHGLGVHVVIADRPGLEPTTSIDASCLIDCTGLSPDVGAHPLVADLLSAGLARLNPLGRLDVDENFEIREARNGHGRMFATGALTLGGVVAPVDSFWGLNRSALAVCDELARRGLGQRITPARSARGWYRRARGRRP